MKIVVLHWHGVCPHCGKPSCIYADFYTDEDGTKLPTDTFRCDSCNCEISGEEFDKITKIDVPCPREILEDVKSKP